jgi:hypothetical protein
MGFLGEKSLGETSLGEPTSYQNYAGILESLFGQDVKKCSTE